MTRAEAIEVAARAILKARESASGMLFEDAERVVAPLYGALQAAVDLPDDFGEEWIGSLKAEFARRDPGDHK